MKRSTLPFRLSGFALGVATLGVTASVMAAPAIELAQTTPETSASSNVRLKEKDLQFVNDAASGGQFEIEASRLAATRSSDPKIKDFAQHMVTDHDKNAAMLKEVAAKKGVVVATTMAPKEQKKFDKLKAEKTGKDFDKAYCSAMLTSHKDAVGRYMGAKDDVADSDLRSYAATSLPTLKHHTEMAQALQDGKG